MKVIEVNIDELHTLYQAVYTARHYIPEHHKSARQMLTDADALIKEKSRAINRSIEQGLRNDTAKI